jgi:DNA repair exonuclease SbcCD ATPase subunit|tara:strand:+ start:414 stop:2183 length:1770 start_codon:yes stop_codon:yes gene_type:complete
MLELQSITLKNFMSVGAVTQGVTFTEDPLTLVLGNNIDLGSNGSRNGTGKTTLVNAISYALYGTAITNIKRDNLINKTNGKEMVVSLKFKKDNHTYKIERGRRPNKLKFYVDNIEAKDENTKTDEAQGEMRHTQETIEDIIKMSPVIFKHILALNTYTEPFLNMRAQDQREFIEDLLGITELSKKADILKEQIKETKNDLLKEEYNVKSIQDANEKIQAQISKTEMRSKQWDNNRIQNINDYNTILTELNNININDEIENHKKLEIYNSKTNDLRRYKREITQAKIHQQNYISSIESDGANLETAKNHQCYACGQDIHDNQHKTIADDLTKKIEETSIHLAETERTINKLQSKIDNIGDPGTKPVTFYDNIESAYTHQQSIGTTKTDLQKEKEAKNPHIEQITSLKSGGLQQVSYDTYNQFMDLKNHQEFLLKLLINKDSFIRKSIIEQNLLYLNTRLDYYLTKMGLPHEVKFLNDLSVEITEIGRDLDFDNLSRGEKNRLILSLSWAFRDVFENLNSPISLMFIDELIDNGTDTNGVEAAIAVLKKITRDRNKNIFLISHREELMGRVSNVLNVVKENGFTGFSKEDS